MLRDFLATCAALARAGRMHDLHEFIGIVFKLLNPPPPSDAIRVVLTPGKPTPQL